LTLPLAPHAVFDHLGRERATAKDLDLTSAPLFVLMPKGTHKRLTTAPPPAAPKRLKGKPSPIVLQSIWPAEQTDLKQSAYRVRAGKRTIVSAFAYNFSAKPVKGRLSVEAPAGWNVEVADVLDLPANARHDVPLVITVPGRAEGSPAVIRVTGDFGRAGRALLSLRLLPQP
jgi:hypothetical protein